MRARMLRRWSVSPFTVTSSNLCSITVSARLFICVTIQSPVRCAPIEFGTRVPKSSCVLAYASAVVPSNAVLARSPPQATASEAAASRARVERDVRTGYSGPERRGRRGQGAFVRLELGSSWKDSTRLDRRLWRRSAPSRLDFSIQGATRSASTLVREPLKLLTRYILREQFGPLVFALSSLTALLLLQQVAKQFGNLVGKGLGWGVIGEFFLLSIPFIIAMTMPMGVLVAVLYAFSRLTAENEITALRASGISVMRLVRPAIAFGAVLGLLMLIFNDQVLPRSNHRLRTLQTDIARKKPTFALREQVINEVMPGKLFLRTSHIDEATDRMREVTIYNFDDPERRKTIYSDSGLMGMTPDQKDLQMTLHDGYMQQIPRDNLGELTRLYFRTDLVRVRGVGNRFEQTEKDDYKSEREMSVCEMSKGLEDGNQELVQARTTLGNTLASATHFLATGQQLVAPKIAKPTPRRTAGSLYCRLTTPLFGNAAIADTESVVQANASANAARSNAGVSPPAPSTSAAATP